MTIEEMAVKVQRQLRKKTPKTAGELAHEAGLACLLDGSGRRIAKPLALLVARGVAVCGGRPGHRTYTKA